MVSSQNTKLVNGDKRIMNLLAPIAMFGLNVFYYGYSVFMVSENINDYKNRAKSKETIKGRI